MKRTVALILAFLSLGALTGCEPSGAAPTPTPTPTVVGYTSDKAEAAVAAAAKAHHIPYDTINCASVFTGFCALLGNNHTGEVGQARIAVLHGQVVVRSIRATNGG